MSDKTQIDDGGPAFTIAHHLPGCDHDKGCVNECPVASLENVTGMSLLAYFMAHVTVGEDDEPNCSMSDSLGVCPNSKDDPIGWLKWRAALHAIIRVIKADAMIRALQKPSEISERISQP